MANLEQVSKSAAYDGGGLPLRGCAIRRTSGFTLFELIIVVIVVAIFAGILLGRFLTYQELAEKAAMEQTAGAVRSALNIQVAGLIARGRAGEIPKLATINPMRFLTDQQKNYAGEFFDIDPEGIPSGSWYFDLKHKELVYLVDRGTHFAPDGNGQKWVRYKVVVVRNEDFPALFGNRNDVAGIALKEVKPYKWDIR